MSALTLKNQRYYIASDEDWRVFNQYRTGNQLDFTILERHNIPMTVGKFKCLRDGTWLNDEVINFYMSMLQNYDERKYMIMRDYIKTHSLTIRHYRKSHFFNTFLMERLLNTHKEYRFDQVVRWFKNIPNILEIDKFFIPININNTHWTLGVVYIQLKKIVYYCSVHGKGGKYLEGLKRWIKDSYLHYGVRDEDWSQWTFDEDRKCPRQTDGYSCGVFVCMFADFLVDNLKLDFTASDVKVYFRSKIGIDILRGELSYCNSI
jgi:Ulp1 family protease